MSPSVRALSRATTQTTRAAVGVATGVVAVLLLGGCGGSGAVAGGSSSASPAASSASASPSESAGSSESPSTGADAGESASPSASAGAGESAGPEATGGASGEAGAGNDEMVASVLSKVRTPTGGKLTPMSAKQVRQATSAANAAARSAVVTPAACKELSLKASSVPETAGVGMATATGGKVVVALVIGKDPAELQSRVTGARELLQTCAKVTLKSAKQTVSQTLTPLTMDRVGDDSVAVLNTQSTSGVTVVMTQLSAWKGNRMVTVSGVGKPSDASDLAELGQLATKALTTPAAGGGATA